MSDFRLTPEKIGANNYSDYDEAWCEGHFCPRDCEGCPWSVEFRDMEVDPDQELDLEEIIEEVRMW